MIGWSTVFGILTLCSPLTTYIEKNMTVPAEIATALFGTLFLTSVLTGTLRGRA